MKLVYCVSIVSAFLILCDAAKPTTTTKATTTHSTTGRAGMNLKGKMITVSQDNSGVTFYPPHYPFYPSHYQSVPAESKVEGFQHNIPTTHKPTTPSPTPATRGVSVCLRFLAEGSYFRIFTLDPGSSQSLTFSVADQQYILSRGSSTEVYLNPMFFLWSWIGIQPWTSVCVLLDSITNEVQVFQGELMSIRKIAPFQIVWSGTPVLDVSEFDGQVTDVEVWGYPLNYKEVASYMQNSGSSGTVLTWSNIALRYRGKVLLEDSYPMRQSQPISSSEEEERPLKHRMMRNGMRPWMRQRKRQMI